VNGRWERVVEEKNNSTRLIFLMLAAVAAMDVSTGGGETVVPDFSALHNPVWISKDNLRAPSVLKAEDGYHLFYSRVSAGSGGRGNPTNWHVAEVVTTDFLTFTNDHRVCLKNHEGWGINQSAEVNSWHRDINPSRGTRPGGFVITHPSPLTHQPAAGAFPDPAAGQSFEAGAGIRTFDDLGGPFRAESPDPVGEGFASVTAIHSQDAQPGEPARPRPRAIGAPSRKGAHPTGVTPTAPARGNLAGHQFRMALVFHG
jgi:hypothetical protein